MAANQFRSKRADGEEAHRKPSISFGKEPQPRHASPSIVSDADLDRIASSLPDFLSWEDVARVCNLSRSGAYKLMRSQACVWFGKSLRWPKTRFLSYLSNAMW